MVTLDEPAFTVGDIAEIADTTTQQVAYVIMKRRLKARRRCGIIRLFDAAQVEAIKHGLCELRPYAGARG